MSSPHVAMRCALRSVGAVLTLGTSAAVVLGATTPALAAQGAAGAPGRAQQTLSTQSGAGTPKPVDTGSMDAVTTIVGAKTS